MDIKDTELLEAFKASVRDATPLQRLVLINGIKSSEAKRIIKTWVEGGML